MARTNMEKGSLGVMRAARMSTTTIAYFRQLLSWEREMTPMEESARITDELEEYPYEKHH